MISFADVRKILPFLSSGMEEPELPVYQILYDSRLVTNGHGGLFFALKSERSDGHSFIPQASAKGVRQWVISDPSWADWLQKKGNQNWLLVENVLETLQAMAAWHRNQFDLPVLGITGSNGKTIVKEWLAQLIGPDRFVCKSPKSFNSQLGVALSVWNLSAGHTLGIFEAGISRSGEMKSLRTMIRPTLGILTNLATAHQEGFENEEEKYREKLSLFSEVEALIMPVAVEAKHRELIASCLPGVKIRSWSWGKPEPGQPWNLITEGEKHPFYLPFRDEASLENLGNAITMVIFLGISPGIIQNRLHLLNQPEMRLSLKEGLNRNVLIDDSYTNDLTGLEAALQFAALQRKEGQELILILSDLEESSESMDHSRQKIALLLESYEVNRVVTVGHQFIGFPFPVSTFARNFPDVKTLVETLGTQTFSNAVLLVKGARKFKLETLVNAWQKKIHGTRLEINLDAMVHNLNFYRSQLPQGTGIMAMVKALGYGSGDEEIARMLEFHNIAYLAVAYADEGVKLREAGISSPIMVMNPTEDALPSIMAYGLEPEIYSFRILDALLENLENRPASEWPAIHIKADTGMHRLGFLPEEGIELCRRLAKWPELRIASVFSHLAGADEDRLDEYSRLQIRKFDEFCAFLQKETGRTFKKHILNSAGILRFPEAEYDLVRLGIGLYGIEVNAWFQNQLRPVSSLKTTISQIKTLAAGESVGYGRRTILERESRIATIAIGYSDGFRRDFSQGRVNVKCGGKWVPVVGNVCMDMTMIDVTDTLASEGDEVILFDDAESLLQLASAAETIPYEILTGIGHRVKRIFFRE